MPLGALSFRLRPMAFHIDEMLVLEIGQARFPDGTKIETSTPIGRVVVVESFPARLNWHVAVKFTADTRSTLSFDADVIVPRGPRSVAHLKFVAEPGPGREEFPLPVFTAPEHGMYRVHLYVNGATTPSASEAILVNVAASLA